MISCDQSITFLTIFRKFFEFLAGSWILSLHSLPSKVECRADRTPWGIEGLVECPCECDRSLVIDFFPLINADHVFYAGLSKDLAAAEAETWCDHHKFKLVAIIPGQYLLEMTCVHILRGTVLLLKHKEISLVLVTFPGSAVLSKCQLVIFESVTRKVHAHGSKS